MRRWLPATALIIFIAAASSWLWTRSASLATITRGGEGPPTLVLLHGYGSRAEDWLQFEPRSPDGSGAPRGWQLPPETRRVYPQAPLRGPLTGQRGWWWLRLESYVPEHGEVADMTRASPGGIKVAARLVRSLLAKEKQPLILGGFSQGAMTSAEIAFQTDQELTALILLSGTTVNEAAWAERFAGRRHLPIFIAHGRNDRVLSFAIMERFQARLKAFGMNVTWYPFEGGHAIPDEVVTAVNAFVARAVGLQSDAGRD